MTIPALTTFVFFIVTTVTFADSSAYNGPDNPIIPADNDEIRLNFAQCIEDTNELMPDNDAHDLAKNLCELRVKHQAARQQVLKGLAELVAQYKGVTNHQHDQNLAQTISLIQGGVKSCLDAIGSQEVCHNIGCAIVPETDATLCDNQAMIIINRILGRE
ncbi:hypothetical protein BN59_02083 [Legionella massiliensis]|uniref:Secreted protein n=1 Tax=Legionella massiliensis TaxID=1034943 RepID=A0A078L148_9GAMM|nr:hypothetical protein [Legionella massiliensis]CDZ77793.1 hypothetical protein BN59_02083 [Legionella massiliensis]CEE13531.1 hypothetical protein BN1094_02083 [Legionella massiliensis]